ncbi:MAG: hypothetical protein IKQ03_00220 [Prevotella sp.]|jgi:hypothetical protein|nr:hypothetical protein [Prevotella sp.]
MKERHSDIKQYLNGLSWPNKVIMTMMLPIFMVVAGIEHLIAKLTGSTYNEVNIIVYYLIIPLSWTVMIDYLTKLPFLTPMFVLAWVIFLWKDTMKFRDRCDWAFQKSVDFLLWFRRIGWNYIVSSVIICVVVPIIIYIELIYAIIK